jgi:hypothetical protein
MRDKQGKKNTLFVPDCSQVDAPRERGHRQDPGQQAVEAAHDLDPPAKMGHHRRSSSLLK